MAGVKQNSPRNSRNQAGGNLGTRYLERLSLSTNAHAFATVHAHRLPGLDTQRGH